MALGNRILIGEDKVNWSNMDSVIEFYETNQLYFNNFDLLTDIELIIEVLDIKLTYCKALDSKHRYSKMLPILEQVIVLLPKIKESDVYERINERYLFNSGIAYERIKNFKESQKYFDLLIKKYPEDELYKRWYKSNKNAIWAKNFRILGYTGVTMVVLIIFMQIAHVRYNRIFLMIGVISIIVGFFIEDVRNAWERIKK